MELLRLALGPAAGTATPMVPGLLADPKPAATSGHGHKHPSSPAPAPHSTRVRGTQTRSSAGDRYRPVPEEPPVGAHKPAVLRRGSTRALTAAAGEWCTASPLSRGRRTACPCVCRRAEKGRIRNGDRRKASSGGRLQELRTTAGAQEANAPHGAG